MLYHIIVTLRCGHPVHDLGFTELKSLANPSEDIKSKVLTIMELEGLNRVYVECRKAETGKISKRWGISSTDFTRQKPDDKNSARPNIDNVDFSSNIRTSLWVHGNIYYLDELREWKREHVQKLSGMGPIFFAELDSKLKELGIQFLE